MVKAWNESKMKRRNGMWCFTFSIHTYDGKSSMTLTWTY